MVILVVLKGFLLVKNLEILIQILPDRSIYYYLNGMTSLLRFGFRFEKGHSKEEISRF